MIIPLEYIVHQLYAWTIFVFASIVFYLVPGLVLSGFLTENRKFIKLLLAIIVGLVSSTFLSFFLGLLGLRDLVYLWAFGLNVLFWWQNGRSSFHKIKSWCHLTRFSITLSRLPSQVKKTDWWVVLIVLMGMTMAVRFNWNFGQPKDGGISFCCSGVPDTIYHLALTSELKNHMPPMEPGLSDVEVTNYHYWSNLAMANMARLTGIEVNWLVVRMFPVLLLILLGAGFMAIGYHFSMSQATRRLVLIMAYFFGELTYLLRYITTGVFQLDIQFNDNALSLPVGPPRLFSVVVAVWCIYLLAKLIKKPNIKTLLLTAICISSLAGFKIYTFIIIMGGLGVLGLWALIKRHGYLILLPVISSLLALMIYLPVTKLGANGFIINPPYSIHRFIETPELGLVVLELRLQVFEQFHNIPKILLYELGFVAIYILVIYGWLSLGLLVPIVDSLKSLRLFLAGSLLTALFLGIFTSQKVGGLNTTQFLMTLPYFLIIPAAILTTKIVSQIKYFSVRGLVYFVIIILITSSAVWSYHRARPFTSSMDSFQINQEEYDLLMCLKKLPDTGLLAIDPALAKDHVNLYIPLLTDRKMYVAGVNAVLSDHGVELGLNRYVNYQQIYDLSFPGEMEKEFQNKNVKYLYIPTKDAGLLLYNSKLWHTVCQSKLRQVLQYDGQI